MQASRTRVLRSRQWTKPADGLASRINVITNWEILTFKSYPHGLSSYDLCFPFPSSHTFPSFYLSPDHFSDFSCRQISTFAETFPPGRYLLCDDRVSSDTAPRLIEFFGEFDTYQVLFLSSNPSLVVFFFSRRGVSSRSLRLPSPVARVAQQENLYNAQTLSWSTPKSGSKTLFLAESMRCWNDI